MKVFKIRVVYKSGYHHDFDCTEFSVKGGTYTWKAYDQSNTPLILGVNDIESVWQIGFRDV